MDLDLAAQRHREGATRRERGRPGRVDDEEADRVADEVGHVSGDVDGDVIGRTRCAPHAERCRAGGIAHVERLESAGLGDVAGMATHLDTLRLVDGRYLGDDRRRGLVGDVEHQQPVGAGGDVREASVAAGVDHAVGRRRDCAHERRVHRVEHVEDRQTRTPAAHVGVVTDHGDAIGEPETLDGALRPHAGTPRRLGAVVRIPRVGIGMCRRIDCPDPRWRHVERDAVLNGQHLARLVAELGLDRLDAGGRSAAEQHADRAAVVVVCRPGRGCASWFRSPIATADGRPRSHTRPGPRSRRRRRPAAR